MQLNLTRNGLVLRCRRKKGPTDRVPGGEGAFLPCSFWLADCLHLIARKEEARRLFERLLSLRNELGLLSEEYDARKKRQRGNFPQAFSHVALVSTAQIFARQPGATANERRGRQ